MKLDKSYLPVRFGTDLICDRREQSSVALLELGSVRVRDIEIICGILFHQSVFSLHSPLYLIPASSAKKEDHRRQESFHQHWDQDDEENCRW